MASSGSYARGDQPRSVPDPDRTLHDQAGRNQRAYNARQEAEIERKRAEARQRERYLGDRLFSMADPTPAEFPDVGHPSVGQSLIPVLGSGREALADLHDGNYVGAAVNAALATSDVFPVKAVGTVFAKGGIKTGKTVWRTKPWEAKQGVKGVRQWMTDKGFADAGQPVHHWAIPQGGWGKYVPDVIKNQLWNLKPLKDAVEHGRIHGRYTVDGVRLPQFPPIERFWKATPDWFKAANVSVPGHAGTAIGLHVRDDTSSPRK